MCASGGPQWNLEGVSVSFAGVPVFDSLSLCFQEGEAVGVVGPSGCGKSTLLRLLSGELEPDSGIVSRPEGRRGVGVVPQRDLLFPWRTALGNALAGAEIAGRSGDLRSTGALLLRELGLGDEVASYPQTLSGGMRQRVALARALLANPSLLLLDEALAQVDFHQRIKLESLLVQWLASPARTMVLVSHDLDSLLTVSHRVIVFSRRPARVLFDEETPWALSEASPLDRRASPDFNLFLKKLVSRLESD